MTVPLIARIGALVLATTAFYGYVGQMVPQKEVQPPAEVVLKSDLTTADMVKVGREIMDGNHIPYQTAGENLAENNYNASQTVTVANTGLMNSPTHRANILGPSYQQVGIGMAGPSASGQYVFVQLFLQPA